MQVKKNVQEKSSQEPTPITCEEENVRIEESPQMGTVISTECDRENAMENK